jgi:hypothetical protein
MADLVAEDTALRRQNARDWPWLGPGFGALLAVAAPVALLVIGLAAFAPDLVTQDFWLALVSGREIAQHGLPSANHLTVVSSGHRWVDQQWLAQLLLYEIARIGGVSASAAVCLLAGGAALWIAGLTAHHRGASPMAILAFLLLCVVAAPWGMQFRTQALALPLFSLTVWLLTRDPNAERKSTLWVFPVLCLWANFHGSAVIGVGLVAAYGLHALIRGARGPARMRAVACVVLSPLTLLASPYALSLPGYYRLMLVNPPFGREIQEWQRTTPSGLTAVFFLLVGVALVLAVTRRKRLGLFDFFILCLTLATALEAIRGIIWFALASAALLPTLATRHPWRARLEGRGSGALVWTAVGATLAVAIWLGTRPATRYPNQFPHALLSVVHAKTASDHGRVFANAASADWLLWELPSLRGRVAYDVRFEIMTRPQFDRIVAWNGLSPGWRATAAGYSLVVEDPKHVNALVATGRWRRLVSSPRIALAERVASHR